MAKLVTLAQYSELPEALVVKSYLDAQGFFVVIPHGHHLAVSWHHTFALGGVTISVLDHEVADAHDALAACDAPAVPRASVPLRTWVWAGLAWWFCGVPHPIRRRRLGQGDS